MKLGFHINDYRANPDQIREIVSNVDFPADKQQVVEKAQRARTR